MWLPLGRGGCRPLAWLAGSLVLAQGPACKLTLDMTLDM